ncbi:MAG: hypothetical protein ABI781_04820 [Burkholderiales bacterium]
MPLTTALPSDRMPLERGVAANLPLNASQHASAVSWGAILAGAAAAAALSLILLILGTGLGLSSVSPWAQAGITAASFGVSTILWISFTQIVASGMGGYLAGRLRTKWAAVHTDEVYFRDTAHGFLAWAIASLATAALLGSVIGSIVSGGAQASATVAGGAAAAVGAGGAAMAASERGTTGTNPGAYFVDTLFRKDASATATPGAGDAAPPVAEAARIFASGVQSGALPADDARYLGQLVAQRTGLAQADAEKRVTDAFARMQTTLGSAKAAAAEAADKARKASAYGALWLFISLLIGAFVASLAATFGGRRRDA